MASQQQLEAHKPQDPPHDASLAGYAMWKVKGHQISLAVGEGFEPSDTEASLAYQASALNHSATLEGRPL